MKFFRQPLVLFLLSGAALFVLHGTLAGNASDPQTKIRVDRDNLLGFVQYRARRFDAQWSQAYLDGLSSDELEKLIGDYVREEALHREALALQLDRGDYIIKQRLIQKIEYIAEGLGNAVAEIGEAELAEYYAEHQQSYRREAQITFTHVFLDARSRGAAKAQRAAEQQLASLRATAVPFHEAGRYGDRFIYHTNYVERSREFIASHFGEQFASAVFQTATETGDWQGPYASEYGYHLVLVSQREDAQLPALSEVRDMVHADLARQKQRQLVDVAIAEIIAGYQVIRTGELQSASED